MKIEIPYTEYPFDKDKRLCRVCRTKLRVPFPPDTNGLRVWEIFRFTTWLHGHALCSINCWQTMHVANETHLDILNERLVDAQVEANECLHFSRGD